MTFVLTTISAVVPSILLLWYFYKRDLNPEPRGVLIKTFFLGFLIVIPVLIIAVPLRAISLIGVNPVFVGLYGAFIYAAIPEEFFKFLVVSRYSARNPAFDEPMDGVVYGAAASLGFATLENILYVSQGGFTVAVLRAFTSVPIHACLGAILGYYVAQARFTGRRKLNLSAGLLIAVLLHGFYDFPLLAIRGLTEENIIKPGLIYILASFVLTIIVITFIWTFKIVQRLRRDQKKSNLVEQGGDTSSIKQ